MNNFKIYMTAVTVVIEKEAESATLIPKNINPI